jgi:hypothetical protein
MPDLTIVADPRIFPDADAASPAQSRIYALATQALDAPTRQGAETAERAIREALAHMLAADGDALAALFGCAPSVPVVRHLWRLLDGVWRDEISKENADIALALFVLPLVIVIGREGLETTSHPAIVHDPSVLAGILREHGALGSSESFVLAPSLVAAEALDFARLPELFAWQRVPDVMDAGHRTASHELEPAPIEAPVPGESVHLRFLVGSMVARRGVDVFARPEVGPWGIPLTKALSRELALPGASVLVLPRAPQRPLPAVAAGRAAQREVSAQLFASNAIRKLRAAAGEPAAVISAHRAPDAIGGGELRLSLSSPFAPRDAEGFRCPLYALDRVVDVATMLVDLLNDCRVTDVRVVAGVHADRDPATGRTLLFKPDTTPGAEALH